MTDRDYPHTGYGVEMRAKKGWVLLGRIYRARRAAIKAKQSIADRHAPDPGDIRVVALTITRKEDTPND